MKKTFKNIILCLTTLILVSCKGIEFENQKIAKAEEFSKGEAMVFVAEEKNKYENRFGEEIWDLKSGDGNLYFRDYVVSITKSFIEKLMTLKLTAADLNILLSSADEEKIKHASDEYFQSLTYKDLEFINCDENDVYNAYKDYHTARLVIDNLSKNASPELSVSEAKVIKVQYIVFEQKETAEKLIEQLKAKGANFAYFAKTRSLDTEIEMIIKRGDELSTRFPELFYMNTGQTSDVLQFKNKYYIFKCVDDYLEDETEIRRIELLKVMKNNEFKENFKKYDEQYNIKSNSTYWKSINLKEGLECDAENFEMIYYKYFPKNIK
jgi:foldase protein PrsA